MSDRNQRRLEKRRKQDIARLEEVIVTKRGELSKLHDQLEGIIQFAIDADEDGVRGIMDDAIGVVRVALHGMEPTGEAVSRALAALPDFVPRIDAWVQRNELARDAISGKLRVTREQQLEVSCRAFLNVVRERAFQEFGLEPPRMNRTRAALHAGEVVDEYEADTGRSLEPSLRERIKDAQREAFLSMPSGVGGRKPPPVAALERGEFRRLPRPVPEEDVPPAMLASRDIGGVLADAETSRSLVRQEQADPHAPADPWGRAWFRARPQAAAAISRLVEANMRGEELDAAAIADLFGKASIDQPPGFKAAFSGLGDDWSDPTLMALGLQAWDHWRRDGGLDVEAAAEEAWVEIRRLYGAVHSDNKAKQLTAGRFAEFALRWADTAFQKLVTTHTFAAALMCSDASKESMEDLVLPWRAFLVAVPNDMLVADGFEYNRIAVCVAAEGEASLVMYATSAPEPGRPNARHVVTHSQASLADLLWSDPEATLASRGDASVPGVHEGELKRVLRLAKRLVVGLVLSMQHRANFRERVSPARHHPKTREREAPEHRVTTIGRPISVDCRAAVRKFIAEGPRAGKSAPASVQVLVRGHFKRQVVGVGRHGRKVIHVEPYWRGPEDAPILTKPRRVADEKKAGGPA